MKSPVIPVMLIILGGAMIYSGLHGISPVELFKSILQTGKVANNGK